MPCLISPRRLPAGSREPELTTGQALLLGALHGPAEILPISSSGHVTALPWLLGWTYPGLEGELRKSFEVALHAGSALGVLLSRPSEALESIRASLFDRRQTVVLALAVAPTALAGLALERPIERRLGRPGGVAVGLLAGSLAMVLADRSPQAREVEEARPLDGLWLGLAQACALVPGVSRSGATLSAARARRFSRPAARELSARVAGPVLAGAAALKLTRVARQGLAPEQAKLLLSGAAASCGSGFVSARVLDPQQTGWPLWPFVVHRTLLGLAVALRLRRPASTSRRFRSAPR
jgi:undecaprenyl-diphosphatase